MNQPSLMVVLSERLLKNLRNKHILIVDDEQIMRDLLSRGVLAAGCQVSLAEDGLEGLEALEGGNVDVLISDIHMPRMDGITFAREAMRCHPQLTTLLVTGYSDKLSRREAREMGVADLIIKPFKNTEIIHSLRKALALSAQLRSRKQS